MKKLERSRRKKSVVENEDSPIYGGLFDHLLEAPKLNEETNWWHEIERNTNLHTHDDDHYSWLFDNVPELLSPPRGRESRASTKQEKKPGRLTEAERMWMERGHYDLGANENELKGGELAESGAESPMVTPIEPVPKPKKDKKSNKKSEKKPKDAEKKEKKKNKRPKKKNDGVADETTQPTRPPPPAPPPPSQRFSYNPIKDPRFKDIEIKSAEDVVFVHPRFTLETVPTATPQQQRLSRSNAERDNREAMAYKNMMDAATYKAVAERELRKRVHYQLRNEGKALEEMKEMRREDRLANTEVPRPYGTDGSSSTFFNVFNRKEWGGVAFATKLVQRQKAAAAKESDRSGGDSSAKQAPPPPPQSGDGGGGSGRGGRHYYRAFDPRKAFNVTVRDHDSILDLMKNGPINSVNTSRNRAEKEEEK